MNHSSKIPRIIHFVWFGRGEKSPKIKKCMKSWQRYLGDYQFMEWNEDNFDIHSNRYVQQAYESRKYAFVSDYVRLYALYHHGGIYMDTDVEVLKPLDAFLHHEAFSGFEDDKHVPTGLMASAKGHIWIEELLRHYDDLDFVRADGSLDMTTNTSIITNHCIATGLIPNGQYQELSNGVVFYPRTTFCPYDYINGANYITNESYAIHHFAKSWLPAHIRYRSEVKRMLSRVVGPKMISKLRNAVRMRG
ncbi:glycosyltransferase family 32 protein [Paenibacillus mendelii]|uniref:Glycosyltransferase family 32 protein n=1 Tax=Paenibacillus mendelii TaxID=206163 RepID=A0ABV6JJG4_9BACL|nr:glycosyltransferase [Paenibacillus mendelii]MCQ6558984.1 glycosyl transferase [Paenibacillus mendelii]